jgi:hypothetical protein
MRIQVKNYTFSKVNRTITFLDYGSIDLSGIMMIVNVTANKIIYSYINPSLGGTVAGNVLTLKCLTSTMTDADELHILYEDGIQEPTIKEITAAFNEDALWILRRIAKILESNTVVDTSSRQRIIIDNHPANSYPAWGTVPTTGPPLVPANNYFQPTWAGPIDPRWTNVENARLAYNSGIRNQLKFT